MTTGDGFVYREAAQDRGNELGKTLRIGRDGQPPADNPFPAEPKSAAVYTYGHRNPQGLAVDGATGRVFRLDDELFAADSWLAVLLGQNIQPRSWDPMADALPADMLRNRLAGIRDVIARTAGAMPVHEAFLKQYCPASL
jgi:hypothetical protein